MVKTRISALIILIVAVALGYFVYSTEQITTQTTSTGTSTPPLVTTSESSFKFKLGLDLKGGTELIYKADLSNLVSQSPEESMTALRGVIENRVNALGVSEPIVQTETSLSGDHRLVIDLPGVTDIKEAVASIGQTPVLEFKTERPAGAEKDAILAAYKKAQEEATQGKPITMSPLLSQDPNYVNTALTGQYLKNATLDFGSQTSISPAVAIEFNSDGAKLFAKMTAENVGKTIAIYLDGQPISTPVVREAITDGRAQISGNFTIKDAQTLVGRLNSGALPVPIELVSTQTVGASLGADVLNKNVTAGIIGFIVIAIFLILWYRLPGVFAVVALAIYVVLMLTLFKLVGVVMSAAGIAGFILSMGMAIDANILIFERTKEELKMGKSIETAVREGFARAWNSIRDSNVSSMITAVILFWLGTSLVKGFALTFGIGVLASMFTAITVTRIFLMTLNFKDSKFSRFLVSNGFHIS